MKAAKRSLEAQFKNLSAQFNSSKKALEAQINDLSAQVEAKVKTVNAKIDETKEGLEARMDGITTIIDETKTDLQLTLTKTKDESDELTYFLFDRIEEVEKNLENRILAIKNACA